MIGLGRRDDFPAGIYVYHDPGIAPVAEIEFIATATIEDAHAVRRL